MTSFPGNEFPPEIVAASEAVLEAILCGDPVADGGTEGVRAWAINNIATALMAERHRWFAAIDDHKDEIERLRLRIRNDERTASEILQMQKDLQFKVAELHEALTVLLSRVKETAA